MFHFLKCFAYGSNLCSIRLRERTPSASLVAVAKLEGHVLRFHKVSKDGSGKCNAFATGNSTDYIWGAVFDIDSSDEDRLDRAEGLGYGYERKSVDVESTVGRISVFTYVASGVEAIRSDLRPYSWYKDLVLAGATERDLPPEYIDTIQAVVATEDPDEARRTKHERFLSSGKSVG